MPLTLFRYFIPKTPKLELLTLPFGPSHLSNKFCVGWWETEPSSLGWGPWLERKFLLPTCSSSSLALAPSFSFPLDRGLRPASPLGNICHSCPPLHPHMTTRTFRPASSLPRTRYGPLSRLLTVHLSHSHFCLMALLARIWSRSRARMLIRTPLFNHP